MGVLEIRTVSVPIYIHSYIHTNLKADTGLSSFFFCQVMTFWGRGREGGGRGRARGRERERETQEGEKGREAESQVRGNKQREARDRGRSMRKKE